MFRNLQPRIHFVGIGGIGMSGIAEVLLNLGYQVSGSDLRGSEITARLASLGGTIVVGHRAENVAAADVVVISAAVARQNPEVVAARARGVPVIARAEMLAELMRLKTGIAVAGSHGKTTTTSMVAHLLAAAGLDPTAVVGGRLNNFGSNAKLGRGELMVVEADESDGSFLRLSPTVAVVTNIDPEHLDHYGHFDRLRAAFAEFINRVPFYGLAVLCVDHPTVQGLLPEVEKRYVTYGLGPLADYQAADLELEGFRSAFRASRKGESLGRFELAMVGEHNVLNALAALAVADELGVPVEATRAALAAFRGVDRRFTVRGTAAGVTVIDDYGHHPAEVRATLAGARRAFGRRLVVAFQPHRYSRTRDLREEFATAFNDADLLLCTEIYAAGEDPIPGVTGETLVESLRAHGHREVVYARDRAALLETLLARVAPGDLVVTLGAGDITRLGGELLERLQAREAQAGGGEMSFADDLRRTVHGKVLEGAPLHQRTAIRLGGPAEILFQPASSTDLVAGLHAAKESGVPYRTLGGGSNTLIGDQGVRGLVIHLGREFATEEDAGPDELQLGASLPGIRALQAARRRGRTGPEFLAGIPGTLGGQVAMNAGTREGEIGSLLRAVEVARPEGGAWLEAEVLELGYRTCKLPPGSVVTRLRLALRQGDLAEADRRMEADLNYRRDTQPLNQPNLGSTFRNPPGDKAGRLIEAVGLKGERQGDIGFSERHANFLVNFGGGRSSDALALIERARHRVQEKFGIELRLEIALLGEF